MKKHLPSLSAWVLACLGAMMLGAAGTGIMPQSVFSLFERFSTFSAVIFNAALGGISCGKRLRDRTSRAERKWI